MKEEKLMFNTKEGYSLSDIAAVSGNRDGFGDGFGGWWIILLFLFAFGGWGNGFGGWGGNNGANVTADIGYNIVIYNVNKFHIHEKKNIFLFLFHFIVMDKNNNKLKFIIKIF